MAAEFLKSRKLKLFTIEYITAGAGLVEIPGASEYVHGGIIVYNEEVKRIIGVTVEDIYTPECALEMAAYGARFVGNRNDIIVLSITGKVFGESDIGLWYCGRCITRHVNILPITERSAYQKELQQIALNYMIEAIP